MHGRRHPIDERRDELNLTVDAATLEALRRRRGPRARGRAWIVTRALVAADIVGLVGAFSFVETFLGSYGTSVDRLGQETEFLLFVLTLPVWVATAKLYGLYDRDSARADHSTFDDVVLVFHLITVGAWGLFAAASISGVADPDVTKLVVFWASAIVAVTFCRMAARAIVRRRASFVQNAVVLGAGPVGQLLARKFLLHPEYGINVVGFVDSSGRALGEGLEGLRVLGAPEQLPAIVQLFDVDRVVIAFPDYSEDDTLDLVRSLKDEDVRIDLAPQLAEVIGPTAGIHTVEGFPLLALPSARLSPTSRVLKRAMDIVLAGLGVVALAPLFLAIAIAIKLDSRGPVFFRQVRMGAGERTFNLVKFRTMVRDADQRKAELAHLNVHVAGDPRMFKIANDPRVTRVGRILRRYFLDELPQLFNVLRGDMTLVGPRPLILDEDQHVREWARKRLDLKPGMTGLWQVLGRSTIPFEEMVKLDYLYVTTWSLHNDLRLLFRTLPLIARGEAAGY